MLTTSITTITALVLREAREIMGYGGADAATKYGIAMSSLTRYEKGECGVYMWELYEFAEALGITGDLLQARIMEVRSALLELGFTIASVTDYRKDSLITGMRTLRNDPSFRFDKRDEKHLPKIPSIRAKYRSSSSSTKTLSASEYARSYFGCPIHYAILGSV